ncbi:hypothetical protein [Pelagicoccus sp. SDUM812002]|uniref:hypothetical protein n=1 Tax=Pelagicoccus sp. SDUM812002 TaxID=3041266 RepID=UPI00280D9595|nr:hypothetical protein [Pelagicoccus sp. SDUM812002]MDQ8187852.1 hypothetical protein [Pelagicoccus sp. SDUM812002]
MPFIANSTHSDKATSESDQCSNLGDELDALCQRILAYAEKAKVQHFRYCRSPHVPYSRHRNLKQAIQGLHQELEGATALPVCQTLAIDLLRELASLGHQPPCDNSRQQKAAALKINTVLLELR